MRRALALALVLGACRRPVAPVPDASTDDAGGGPCVSDAVLIGGRCYATACGLASCGAGEVCDETRCVSAGCAGVRCRYGPCADGRCQGCSVLERELVDGGCEPLAALGSRCTANDDCLSSACADGVCCSTSCTAQCGACDANGRCGLRAALDPGSPSNPCMPGLCTGESAQCGVACVGSDLRCADAGFCASDTCVPRLNTGAPCARDRQCVSGHCADGVCCNEACNADCERCDADDAGASPGVCRPQRALTFEAACGATACDGLGRGCASRCASDAFCDVATVCDGGCAPRRQPGEACTHARDCTSDLCRGGVCCTSDCAGECSTCRTDGTCSWRDGLDDAGFCDAGHPFCHGGYCCSVNVCDGGCQSCQTGVCLVDDQRRCTPTSPSICKADAGVVDCPATCAGDTWCALKHLCALNGTVATCQ